MPQPKPVSRLRPSDFKAHPIWRFVTDDYPDETWALPLLAQRSTRFTGKIVGTQVSLADGSRRWAILGNIDPDNAEKMEHFLTVSVFLGRRWFHLARYHDFDARDHGPRALAAALGRSVGSVFPIRYDLRAFERNASPWLVV